jgi:O-antigen biosynthesis protein WbqV
MGEPIRIEALARRLIRLAGLSPDKDIEIRFTGRRAGEKLTEILALDQINPTTNDKVFEVRLDHPQAHVVIDKVMELEKMALEGDTERVIALLRELTGADLLAENPVVDAETGSQAAVSWS